jgi:hypothetical protein
LLSNAIAAIRHSAALTAQITQTGVKVLQAQEAIVKNMTAA